jgi:hypothetical protein
VKNRIALYFIAPTNLLWGILGFLSAIVLICYGFYEGTNPSDTFKFCIMSFVLMTIIVYYIGSQRDKIMDKPFFNSILVGSYIISLLMIMAIQKPDEILLWMAGGLVISILFDMQIGLLYTYNLIIIASFIGKLNAQSIVFLMILGTLMSMLSNSMRKQSTLWYSVIIVLSVQVTLLFIINNFVIWEAMNIDAVYNLISILITMGFASVVSMVYQKKTGITDSRKELAVTLEPVNQIEDVTKSLESLLVEETASDAEPDSIGTHTYEEINDSEFPLLLRLKQHSDILYRNALRTSVICNNAALVIGANEKIAKAGGLYYSIGLLESKQYVETGIKLMDDYHMPSLLSDIIKQHNLKYDKPGTPEAAIVMLTVSILSSKEFFEKRHRIEVASGKETAPISLEKIVDQVFLLRLSKGSLDESGLSVKQYNELKRYFLHM